MQYERATQERDIFVVDSFWVGEEIPSNTAIFRVENFSIAPSFPLEIEPAPSNPGWYAEYKVTGRYQTPVGTGEKDMRYFSTKPLGNWWGPFHCKKCADWCSNYGKLENQAYTIEHGSAEESFGETMGFC